MGQRFFFTQLGLLLVSVSLLGIPLVIMQDITERFATTAVITDQYGFGVAIVEGDDGVSHVGEYLEGPYESICGKIPNNRLTELQRLVVFVGPHKTGISSIQHFFTQHTYNYSNDWAFPFPKKEFPRAMRRYHRCKKRQEVLEMLSTDVETMSKPNLMLAGEYFDRKPGFEKLTDVISFLQPKQLDIVAHFRQPRTVQWVSAWKELTATDRKELAKGRRTYQEWLCEMTSGANDFQTWGMRAMNILGVIAQNYSALGGQVTLIDLAGVEEVERDISHVVACDILGWNCDDEGWIEGMYKEEGERRNVRTRDPGLTELQYNNTEWLFLQRDCLYDQPISEKNNIRVLHRTEAFLEGCRSQSGVAGYYAQLADYDYFLKMLQLGTGCNGVDFEIPDLVRILEEGLLQ